MKDWLIALVALSCCKRNPDTWDRPSLQARERTGSAGECVEYHGKRGTIAFCTNGETLTICTPDGCIEAKLGGRK